MTGLPPLRAPRADGEILAVPPLEQVGQMLRRNSARMAGWPELWHEHAHSARSELLALLGVAADPAAPILLAGHQPELFHPGVWLKNFALAGLASRHGATSVNLVIDNDAVKSFALAVPPPPGSSLPTRPSIAFAHGDPETPWEECRVNDLRRFEAVGAEVAENLRAWGVEPIITELWPRVYRHMNAQGGLVGAAFAAARRDLEQAWGCRNPELPMSQLAQTAAFARFLQLLFADPPRLAATYNEAVADYRRRHRLRSKNHPVPDLATDGDWCELPLWAWRGDRQPVRRGRVFARRRGDRVDLRSGTEAVATVAANREEDVVGLLHSPAWKVRSRALTTTMFARLFLADLFLHGIGGGKYDELTDDIIRRLWDIEAPDFLVLTGTCLLPLPAPDVDVPFVRRLARRLRDLDWNPDRYLPDGLPLIDRIVAEKKRWVNDVPATSEARKGRFRRLQEFNAALRPEVADRKAALQRDLDRSRLQLAVREALQRRDYSFCLYPETALRPFCTQLL